MRGQSACGAAILSGRARGPRQRGGTEFADQRPPWKSYARGASRKASPASWSRSTSQGTTARFTGCAGPTGFASSPSPPAPRLPTRPGRP